MTRSARESGRYIFLGSIFLKVISLSTSILLARILVPEDYGNWVLVSVVTSFFSLVVDIGFEYFYLIKIQEDSTAIQKAKLENTIFLLRAIVNLFLFVFQIAVSYLLIDLYFVNPVDKLLRILSIIYLVSIFGKINEVRLKKKLDFRIITISKILGELVSSVAKILLAISGLGVYSFAYGAIVNSVVFSGMLSFQGKFTPNLRLFSTEYIKEIMDYAKHSWIGGLGLFFAQQSDKILLKFFYPISSIGFYSFSSSYSMVVYNSLLMPQNTLFMSYISNNRKKPKIIIKNFTDIFKLILFVVIPLQIPILVYAKEFILYVFGEKWISALVLFTIFMASVIIKSLMFPLMSGLTAIGRLKANTSIVLIKACVIPLILLLIGLLDGSIITYATAFVLCELIFDSLKFWLFIRFIRVNLFKFIQPIFFKFYLVLICCSVLLVLRLLLGTSIHSLLIAGAVYSGLYVYITYRYNSEMLNILKKFVK
jgi:O-antigen/teichoic acid export membrane protein